MWVLRPYFLTKLGNIDFSSPDPKGHERYCHHLASVVICKLLHFNLLFWNQTGMFMGWSSSFYRFRDRRGLKVLF